jgi:predicted nucleic acid-binding protein
MNNFKIYLDTSVISAYFDFYKPLRQNITQKWFQNNGCEFDLHISLLVLEEIGNNTDRKLMSDMLNLLNMFSAKVLELNGEIYRLAELYRKKVLPKEISDTLHIAAASYYSLDAVVSWNFRHIVNLKTMKAICEINSEQGYNPVQILTLENLGGDKYGTL